MSFFTNYPLIKYNGLMMRNLMVKSRLVSDVLNRYEVYYPYIIEDGERLDTIAYDYYGDSNYWWVVMLANNIIDPYYDWPLAYEEFKAYIIKKFGSVAAAKSQIKHYKYTGIGGDSETDITRKSWLMPNETYAALSVEAKSGWTPVYQYDWEEELNDSKRSIQLLDRTYIPQLKKELKTLFND